MRFNEKTDGKNTTTNYEGAKAYTISPELQLYSLVTTASLQNKFYEKTDETINRLRELIPKVSPQFVGKLAIYAREKMYLRSVPLVLIVELSKIHKGDKLIQNVTDRVIQRVDEMTEIMAYYQLSNDRKDTKKLNKLSKQLQKGIAKAFGKFNEYQLGKYNRKGAVTLKDVLFLTHPKAKDKEHEALYKRLIDDKLEVPYTWEVELSKGKDKKETWEQLIDSGKVGYMALMRNLRNILDADVSKAHLQKVYKQLTNKEAVLKSKQLPFRFFSAYRELEDNSNPLTSMLLTALEEAVLYTAENIKGFDIDTTVCIACDVSGSMEAPVSPKSKVQYYDIGLMLGMLLQNRCKSVITGIFGDTWKVKQLSKASILKNVMDLHNIEGEVGYSTNGYKVLQYLTHEGLKVDKIMMFTDCQMWNSFDDGDSMAKAWKVYKAFNPTAKLYLFDMAGYGNTPLQVNDKDVFMIAGWSDKIFEILDALEKGQNAITEIKNITI